MKKFILALAAVAMTAGFSVKADDNAGKCPLNQQCAPAGRHCNAPCDSVACQAACPFADLNLTDAQKQQLKDLKSEQCKARKECAKQAKQARSECRRSELTKIKGILTAEQYVKFLENSYVNGGKPQPRHHHGMKPGSRKELKKAKAMRATRRVDGGNVQVAEKK